FTPSAQHASVNPGDGHGFELPYSDVRDISIRCTQNAEQYNVGDDDTPEIKYQYSFEVALEFHSIPAAIVARTISAEYNPVPRSNAQVDAEWFAGFYRRQLLAGRA